MITQLLNRKKVNPSILTYTGLRHLDEISIQLFVYKDTECFEKPLNSFDEFQDVKYKNYFKWLNVHGIHDVEKIKTICTRLKIHDLLIQDILDVNQRPKFQEIEDYWFFTLKSIVPSDDSTIEQEQLSFILGKEYLISFQEKKADYFDHIRERLRKNVGIVRMRGTDYLLFLLIEAILDNYFKSIDKIEHEIEKNIVIDIDQDPSPILIRISEKYKRHVHQIKKTIVPIKEFVAKIEREKFVLVDEKNIKYFYELKDLCLSLIDACEQIEVKLESSSNLFFSVQGHRMNQVMKTLTVVATIFIPLTFIAGIYGMNFSNMPELNWRWGYLGIWLVMLVILVSMIIYFKNKKWY
jgi:magnesium transporter